MMKKLYCLLALGFTASLYAQESVYLSPEGNDCGKGTSTSPFYSLPKAVEGRLSTTRKDTLFVEIAPGTYYMREPLLINEPNNRPVVFRSKTEKPSFVGGLQIKGWKPWKNGIYRAAVPEVKLYGYSFEQFYVNGKRAIPARTPNKDWFIVKGHEETCFEPGVRSANFATQKIIVDPTDLSTLKDLTQQQREDVKFRFYHKWDNTQKHPIYLNVDSGFIYLRGLGMKPWNPITKNARYVMSGYMKALDVQGEWFLDKEEGYVYYMPYKGECMESADCIAPTLSQWIVFHGNEENSVNNIHFQNLSFQCTSYKMPNRGDEAMQAAASIMAGAEFEYATHITFDDCEMKHTGGYACWFKRGCHYNQIRHSYLADLGAGGVKIGEPYFPTKQSQLATHNMVHNSIITDAGHVFPCGVGVGIFHAADNEVTHNDIFDLYYSGVSIGWVWGYNRSNKIWTNVLNEQGEFDFLQMELVSPAVRNLVAYNHIHHIGWGELSDMGAVYTLGESPGTRVVHNVINDVLSYDYGGWGLYTDEGSTGVEMSHNLVYRCKSGGFHQHYGKDNKIENNILAYGHYYNVQYTRVEDHTSFSFKHNIILQSKGETLAGPWVQGKLDMDCNLYWNTGNEPMRMGGLTFKEWKKKKERHAVYADPLFVDPENDNFDFLSKKAIRKIGFKPFDYHKVGVYGSKTWKNKAKMSDEKLKLFKQIASVRLKK